jgi:capsular exopolysaccharide synthesis family protein
MQDNQEQESITKSIDLNKIIAILLSRWYLLLFPPLIALTVAYIILRYEKPVYISSTNIKFEDDRGAQLSDIFRYGRSSGRIENLMKTESEVLNSKKLATRALRSMNQLSSATIKGNIVSTLLYPNPYFDIEFIRLDSNDLGKQFTIQFTSNGSFTLTGDGADQTIRLSDTFIYSGSVLRITSSHPNAIGAIDEKPIIIRINNPETDGVGYANRLGIEQMRNTSIVNLSFTHENPDFAADYLNALTKVYLLETVEQKALAAENTITYIDYQLGELSKSVRASGEELAKFKVGNKTMAPQELGRIEFENLVELETQKRMLDLRKKQLMQIEGDILKAKSNDKTIELIVMDPTDAEALGTYISTYNELVLERIELSSKNTPGSIALKNNTLRLSETKNFIVKTIAVIKRNIDDNINDLNNVLAEKNAILSTLPAQEQELFQLERNFKINEKIYGFLLEKRLETMISRSAIIANVSIIDDASVNRNPISPIPSQKYSMALLIGLVSGVGSILLLRLFYNRIPDKETIEGLIRVPVLGIIKKLQESEDDRYGVYVYRNPKSVFAESIRGIRTNSNFILKGERHKVICITSTVSGEGKTFCTINLAASVAQLGLKVVIVGCDLRRPKMHEAFENMSNQKGLTSYLVNRASLDEIVQLTAFDNLYAVPAGPTPPNPAELLQTPEFEHFMVAMRNRFDYIFLDTAPVGLVADSLTLMAQSDLNLYIMRAQYSKKDFCVIPETLSTNKDIKNLYIILNAFDAGNIAYSSVYKGDQIRGKGGYYYGNYYGRSAYGSYGKGYHKKYYSDYYSEEEPKPFNLKKQINKLLKRN